MERKNERGGEQELRERSRARMRKRKGKILRDLMFFICDCSVVNFLNWICSLSC